MDLSTDKDEFLAVLIITVTVGTCLFPHSADIVGNLAWIKEQMRVARDRDASAVHFPKGATHPSRTVSTEVDPL